MEEITQEDALEGDETLRWRFKQQDYLRPVDLARMAGLGVTQIRTYERVGFLPPAERGENGYRRYTPDHVEALRVARILIAGYGWQNALDVMRAVHSADRLQVFALVNARHTALDGQRARIMVALETTEAVLRRPAEAKPARDRPFVQIQEAARTVGVRASAVRFWEREGLLQPLRQASTGYRLYDAEQLGRLNVVALLRDVDYRFDAIREVLDELAVGRPDQIRRALEGRLETLNRTSWDCIAATAALHGYLASGATRGRTR
ncbi:MerR family transcriptional regulator [Streptomyces sp. SID13031]|uniref:MerR family transcriptional regulator n=1 Tax=Streptomyces sp. SID13031 TaxID=2706046 RepID=UPI0013C9A0EC|nr:MerR family transcriptional regulator [Streptomyces sp. SID13031]NEA36551.1 MerR family transcriptional regulator [Streptomyces sp. SID13031]